MKRYPGAQPFKKEQQNLFFGRQHELGDLFRLVQVEQIVILFAKSGMGKSSLLNAGLIPKAIDEKNYLPVSIRFGAHTEHSETTPLQRFRDNLLAFSKPLEASYLEKISPPNDNSLWVELKKRQRSDSKSFLLVFDQFEEIFTYPVNEVEAFGQQLSELLYSNIPDRFRQQLETYPSEVLESELHHLHRPLDIRTVIAIRSDRMSLLNKLSPWIPNILENCLELRSLSPVQAQSAILEPAYLNSNFESPIFDYEDEAVENLIRFLRDGDTDEIESFQLQILCEYFERTVVIRQNRTLITSEDIAKPDQILENYYLDKISELPILDRLPARRLIEEGLIFEEEGRRLNLYEGQIAKTYMVDEDLLRRLLDTHLIRSEPSTRGGYSYELSHDTLVAPVLKAKGTRKLEEARFAEWDIKREREQQFNDIQNKKRQAAFYVTLSMSLLVIAVIVSFYAISILKKLDTTKAYVVDAITKEATIQISRLDYSSALEKLSEASQFKKLTPYFLKTSMELAWFYNEAKLDTPSMAALRLIELFPSPDQAIRRKILLDFNYDHFQALEEKYYPQMMDIKGGEYTPGCLDLSDCQIAAMKPKNNNIYRVQVDPFLMAQTETTFYQYNLFCAAKRQDIFKLCGPISWGFNGSEPAVNVSWYNALEYANWLSQQLDYPPVYEIFSDSLNFDENNLSESDSMKWKVQILSPLYGFRLPTDGEWEWAAHGADASVVTIYAGSTLVNDVAWYVGNSGDRAQPVSSRKPNSFGLFDMSGNVWEWCWDWYWEGAYPSGLFINPSGPIQGKDRILRGGSWVDKKSRCEITYRTGNVPNTRNDVCGFRLVRNK